jgi:hypothetical protein
LIDGEIDEHGWREDFEKGAEMVRKLSALKEKDKKYSNNALFRGLRVAFFGYGAPPGATNDLLTPEGYYLRILNKKPKDLRPMAAVWTVLVCGRVCQVFPENRLILLEVNEEDWIILDTK